MSTKAQLKTEIRTIEARAKAHTTALASMAMQWDRLMERYHGVAEGVWVVGTGASGIEYEGPVVAIDWSGVSLKQKPVVTIRARNPVTGNVGMRKRVLTDWKLYRAKRKAA